MNKMIKQIFAVFLVSISTYVTAEQLSIERIHSAPDLAGDSLSGLKYAPDGSRVTYLKNRPDDLHRFDLWEYNISANKHQLLVDSEQLVKVETLSDEEKARRERQRIYGTGILEYFWADDGSALLFPLNGDVYYYHLASKQSENLTQSEAFETDAKFSPNNRYVSYIRNKNIWLYDLNAKQEVAVTNEQLPNIKNGMAEFVAQEEMDRMTGYWWNKDASKIAFLRVDESPVQVAVRNEIYAEEIKLFEQKYPFTGTDNVKIKFAVYDLATQKTQWVDLGSEQDIYIPRVKWLTNNTELSYQLQTRDQQQLQLKIFNTQTQQQYTALTETSQTWINLHHDLYFLKDQSGFIWASERDGYRHLYLYNFSDLSQPQQLTSGPWQVDKTHVLVDSNKDIYFSARKDSVLESRLYKVNINQPNKIINISKRAGQHNISFAQDGSGYIDNFSTINSPWQVSLHNNDGRLVTWLMANKLNSTHPLYPYTKDWNAPEYGTLQADDGQTLHFNIYKPKHIKSTDKLPVIVRVYGGPHAQRVNNQWSNSWLWNQVMVNKGYIVFALDNRGSYNRGKQFEDPIYKHLGEVELQDQITGVKYLRTLPYVDPKRIGIYGHSYGGYMTIMAMFKAPEYFSAGVSGAPVTDWALYDTHYTERYLGHPQLNKTGYQASSVFSYVEGLKGPILIYHGMADDNVLFTHSTKLYKTLQDANKQFEIGAYPGSKHSMRGKSVKIHLDTSIIQFFERHFNSVPKQL